MRKNHGWLLVASACSSLFFPLYSFADSIKCYANDKLIYSRQHIKELMYNGIFFAFMEDNTGKIVIAKTNCIVKLDT